MIGHPRIYARIESLIVMNNAAELRAYVTTSKKVKEVFKDNIATFITKAIAETTSHEILKFIFEYAKDWGVNVGSKESQGMTYKALDSAHPRIFMYLLKNNYIECPTPWKLAYHFIDDSKYPEFEALVREAYLTPHYVVGYEDEADDTSLLQLACERHAFLCANLLITLEVNLDYVRPKDGNTALHILLIELNYALQDNDKKMICNICDTAKALFDKKARHDIRNKSGQTALDLLGQLRLAYADKINLKTKAIVFSKQQPAHSPSLDFTC